MSYMTCELRREILGNWELMEGQVTQGKMLTLAPFCRGLQPWSTQLGGRGSEVGGVQGSVFREHCVCCLSACGDAVCPPVLYEVEALRAREKRVRHLTSSPENNMSLGDHPR